MMPALATAEDLRNFLSKDEIDVARAELFLDGVSDEIRKFSDQSFADVATETITLDGSGHSNLLLPSLPVRDVISVTEGDTELVDGTDYEWSSKGMLRRLTYVWAQIYRNVVVEYSHGYDEVPNDVRMLTVRVAARGYVNPTAVAMETMGGYSAQYGFDASRICALTDTDRDILRPYMGR